MAFKPWNEKGSIWKTESTYWAWVRGQIRRAWSRYPVKNAFLRDRRTKEVVGRYKNGKPRSIFCGTCDGCEEVLSMRKLVVDHIIPAGSLRNADDLQPFITKLFCSYDNMQLLCKECHDTKTYADKHDITLEEAKRGQAYAAFKKLKAADRDKLIKQAGGKEKNMKNNSTREDFMREHLNITW